MIKPAGRYLLGRLALSLTGLALFASSVNAAEPQIIIIANLSVQSTSLSKNDLRDAFTGISSSIGNGLRITPVLLRQGAAHEEMLAVYVGKSDAAFRASWRSLVFSGQGVMPKSLDTEAGIVEYVAHTAGAIGYIGKATPHDGVKTLAVR